MDPDELRDFFSILKELKGKNSNYLSRKFALYNITYEQWVVLRTIKRCGIINQKKLSLVTQKSCPTLTRVLDHLENKNMIERIPNISDRRSISLNITTLGEGIYQKVSTIENEFHKKIASDISESDVKQVKQTLYMVLNNINSQIFGEQENVR